MLEKLKTFEIKNLKKITGGTGVVDGSVDGAIDGAADGYDDGYDAELGG